MTMVAYNGDELPQLHVEDEGDESFGRIVAEPLRAGFGITIGNALRRTLLSALPGAAVTAVRIDGVEHEFSTIPHMKEDVVEFLLNIKDIRIRALSDRPGKMYLEATGPGEVTAGNIQQTADYEIVNPDLHLATLDSGEARLSVEMTVDQGGGYQPAGSADGMAIGVIPMDAIFSPVRRVNYKVEHTRVGQVTNFDRLILEVWTDGTINPVDAVSNAAEILADQFALFSRLGRPQPTMVGRGLGSGAALAPGPLQHADRRPQPLGACLQLPQALRPDDGRRSAREERGRAAGPAQLRPQVLRRAAGEADQHELPLRGRRWRRVRVTAPWRRRRPAPSRRWTMTTTRTSTRWPRRYSKR